MAAALEEYRVTVAAYLQGARTPVLFTLLGQDVPRPEALKTGKGKMGCPNPCILHPDSCTLTP